MAKQPTSTQRDGAELVEPRSFEELAQRANEAALSDDANRTGSTFEDCFSGEEGHRKCMLLPRRFVVFGAWLVSATVVAGVAGSASATVFSPAVTRFFMTAAMYGAIGAPSMLFLGGFSGYWLWRRNGRRCPTKAPKTVGSAIATNVTTYLGKLIAEEQRRCIGEGSEIEELRKRADGVLDRTRTLLERLRARVSEEQYHGDRMVPAYLRAALTRAERLFERLTSSRDRLSQHRAKLDAFFQECRTRVEAAEKPLHDLELVEAVEALDTESERLGTEVQDVIVRSTGELFGRLQQLRSTLGVSLANAGVHLALSTPTTSNLERDASVLEDTIQRFRPPKIVEGGAADEARVAQPVRGPIGVM